ncbi:Uncharacterised protein [Enterobacter hormaechei]|nr:Uncharacterised protein [Enterobacter hormaechei]
MTAALPFGCDLSDAREVVLIKGNRMIRTKKTSEGGSDNMKLFHVELGFIAQIYVLPN